MKVWIMMILCAQEYLEQATDKLDRRMTDLALRFTEDTLSQANAIAELGDRKRRLVNLSVLAHRLESALGGGYALLKASASGQSIAEIARDLQLSRTTVFRRQRTAFQCAETLLMRLGFDARRMLADYGSIALCRRVYALCARRCRAAESAMRSEEDLAAA